MSADAFDVVYVVIGLSLRASHSIESVNPLSLEAAYVNAARHCIEVETEVIVLDTA